MEINDAILILQTHSQNLGAEINRLTDEKSAVDLAIEQLQGTLTVNLAALDQAQADIVALTDTVTTLQSQAVDQPIVTPSIDTPPIDSPSV